MTKKIWVGLNDPGMAGAHGHGQSDVFVEVLSNSKGKIIDFSPTTCGFCGSPGEPFKSELSDFGLTIGDTISFVDESNDHNWNHARDGNPVHI